MKLNEPKGRAADCLDFEKATALVRKLSYDKSYTVSLLIGCGCFFGLRISDLLTLTWDQLLSEDETFTLVEQKTGKPRTIKINNGFRQHIIMCHDALGIKDDSRHCFISRKGTVFSVQRVNRILKEVQTVYFPKLGIKARNFSTHSLRKTFGRKVFENAAAEGQGEMALVKLSVLFNHSNPKVTRIYLGITKQELLDTYDSLNF